MRCSVFKGILFFVSVSIVVVVLYGANVVGSKPKGWWDNVSAAHTADREKVYWWNEETDHLVVRVSNGRGYEKNGDFSQLAWADDRLYFTRYEGEQRRLGWLSISGDEVMTAVIADSVLPAPSGKGVYVFRETDAGGCEVGFWDGEALTPQFRIFEHLSFELGNVSKAAISKDERYLAIGAWGNNEPDGLEVWDLRTKQKVLEDDEEASELFFAGEGGLYTVRSTAAIVQLHHYDLKSGQKVRSSQEFSGSAVADISDDGSYIAVARAGFVGDKVEHLEVFDAKTLRKEVGIVLEEARELIEIDWVGERLHAVDRSGGLWEIDVSERRAEMVGRLIPERKDYRAFGLVGMVVAIIVAVVWCVRARRKLVEVEPGDKGVLRGLLAFAALVEVLSWLFVFSGGLIGGIGWFFVHFVFGCALLVFAIWIAVLKLPERWGILLPAVGLAFLGASVRLYILISAISSV